VSEFGHEGNLLSEFDKRDIIDGGYREPNRIAAILGALRTATNDDSADLALAEEGEAPPEGMNRRIHVLRGEERTE